MNAVPSDAKTPPLLRIQSAVFGVFVVVTLVFSAVTPWVQTAQGIGSVIPLSPQDRIQRVDAPITGRIVEWHVIEGDVVEEGTILATMIDVDPGYLSRLERNLEAVVAGKNAAEEQSTTIRAQIDAANVAGQLNVNAARQKVDMAEQKRASATETLQASRVAEEVARINADRVQALANDGLVSTRDVELAQLEVAKASAATNKARAAVSEATASILAEEAALKRASAVILVDVAKARADLQKSRRDEAKAAEDLTKAEIVLARQQAQVVRAPVHGTVLWVNHELSGGIVKSGEKLVVVTPKTARPAAELWMDGNDLPLLQPGRSVRLQFEGWPSIQFDGWPSVAVGTFAGVLRAVDSASQRDGKFRVVVVPADDADWPGPEMLRQGVRARGVVLLDEVPLLYEGWRLLNDFPARLEVGPDATTTSDKEKRADGDEK